MLFAAVVCLTSANAQVTLTQKTAGVNGPSTYRTTRTWSFELEEDDSALLLAEASVPRENAIDLLLQK
jgi:hypothetical protein